MYQRPQVNLVQNTIDQSEQIDTFLNGQINQDFPLNEGEMTFAENTAPLSKLMTEHEELEMFLSNHVQPPNIFSLVPIK